jgi:5-methylcytosine-specific restriction endonuclease McrA
LASSRPDLDKSRWQTLRREVRRRDGNRCRVCGATEKLSVHHIVKARNGGRDTLDNLVTLCARHHRQADALPSAVFSPRPVTPRPNVTNPPPIEQSRAESPRVAETSGFVGPNGESWSRQWY